MATWFSKSLGDGLQADGMTQRIMKDFTPLSVASGLPADMAVFSGHDSQRNVIVYFSPGAWELATIYGAQRCKKPPKEELVLLTGNAEAWEYFYP